ncbi:hypothetical protein RD110_05620 [Rhodoferax koreense]|uniref:DUF2868 domain-containing protein n=2 Tax=Rhodoferax koreensis TaxID=1842727 RepID=A0A1P8K3B0_9BURK|nr:hypothetical protein RD110_05620 [Rhodoferax koreense]
MAETVRLVESQGPLDDAQVLRALVATGADGGQSGWLMSRAWQLGRRLGLDQQLQRWQSMAGAALLALVGLVLLGALGAAGSVVHSGRTVNAVAALFSLLGLHAVTLALWLVGLVAPWPSSGGALGRLWLELVARLSNGRKANAANLLQASVNLLRRERLAPWLFGCVSHTVWALSFVVMLAALGFAFSFQAYRLTWETTILSPDFFVTFVRATGWLPGALGFPVPDTATLLAPGAASADQRAWAWWLIGCVAIYGLLPRALLAVFCAAWWRRRAAALRLDTADPYYRGLLARRDALQPAAVVDAEQPWQAARPGHAPVPGKGAAVVGFELPPELAVLSVAGDVWSRRISGTSAERSEVLEALRAFAPARLLLVCHAASSPDRGTARFVREAAEHASAASLLLAGAAVSPQDAARWTDWLGAARLEGIALLTDEADGRAWLEGATHG